MANRRFGRPTGAALAVLVAVALGAGAAVAQSVAEQKFVVHLMNRLQGPSFAQSREYCGYLTILPSGKITTGQISPGSTDGCGPQRPNIGTVIASFHTHGGFTEQHYSEVPSVLDMRGDAREGIGGWIATPGGRLWYLDGPGRTARQVCGVGCLKQDPLFRPGAQGKVATVYTLDKLIELMGPD